MKYWVICITEENLHIAAEKRVLGFRRGLGSRLASMTPRDTVTFYVPRVSLAHQKPVRKFFNRAEIVSPPYTSSEPIWKEDIYPVRIDWKLVSHGACEIKPLINELTFIKNKKHWGGIFMGSILRISAEDFGLIQRAMK